MASKAEHFVGSVDQTRHDPNERNVRVYGAPTVQARSLTSLLEHSANLWGVRGGAAKWIFWLPLVGCVLVAAARLHEGVYNRLLEEDGPVEWSQFVCDALACAFGAGVARMRLKATDAARGWLFAGFALIMFFLAGEEIAWGQRLLGIQTPAAMTAINEQGEITVHNIVGMMPFFRAGMTLVAALGSLSWLFDLKGREKRFPPLFLAPAFFVMFAYRMTRYTVLPTPTNTITYYGEWAELCLAFGFFAFAWLSYRSLATNKAPVAVRHVQRPRADHTIQTP